MRRSTAEQQAHEDGYVECGECGHPIEEHGLKGCETCAGFDEPGGCAERWTKADIRRRRRELGLPGAYSNLESY